MRVRFSAAESAVQLPENGAKEMPWPLPSGGTDGIKLQIFIVYRYYSLLARGGGSGAVAAIPEQAVSSYLSGKRVSARLAPDGESDRIKSNYIGSRFAEPDMYSFASRRSLARQDIPVDSLDDQYWEAGLPIVGANGAVLAVAVFNDQLIIGGYFDAVGGTMANNIAAWNGTS